MPLMEHLYELRNRLFWAMLALFVGAVIGYIWWGVSPRIAWGTGSIGLRSLGDLITGPYCGLQESQRLTTTAGQCQLLQTGPFEAFNTRLKVGVAAGAVLTAPLWLYQIWAFITPGLHAQERRFALTFVGVSSVLFATGAVLAYFVVPAGLAFLAAVGDGQFIVALTADRYIGLLLTMLLAFGVSFLLPVLIVMLNRVGMLPYEKLKSWQRGLLFGCFILAAVATPGSDIISMLALAVSLVLLFEVAVVIAYVHDRRLAKQRAEQGLDDPDAPSRLDLDPGPDTEPDADAARKESARKESAEYDQAT